MLTAVYDTRMDDRKAFLSVGGFVSSTSRWMDFDRKWRGRLAQEGLSYFHMLEFAYSVGDFEPLKQHQQKRRGLIQDLLGIISSHAYRKFGVTVEVKAGDAEFSEQNKLEYAPNALGLAGELACGQAWLWAKAEGFPAPEFVFEDGNPGRAKLAERIKALTGVIPVFRTKKNSPLCEAFTPLQAADILVYEMGLLMQGDTPRGSFSHPFQELNRMPGGILQPAGWRRLRRRLRTPPHRPE
jgi:hypothetical protein